MNPLIDSLDARTKLAGSNRLELLLFNLGTKQQFGINVFKIREVLACPSLTPVPKAHPNVVGLVHLRGDTVMVIDLARAIGLPPLAGREGNLLVVTEYNARVQALVVSGVDRIVNLEWGDMSVPPKQVGAGRYLTAVTTIEKDLVEILDIERVLGEVLQVTLAKQAAAIEAPVAAPMAGSLVLVVDDSLMARRQTAAIMEKTGAEVVTVENGRLAYDLLMRWVEEDIQQYNRLCLIVSDIEMPELDGYTLTKRLRSHPRYKNAPIILHTSLSGEFNSRLVNQVGADELITKYDTDRLMEAAVQLHRRDFHVDCDA